MNTEQAPYMADILLDLIHKDGDSVGEARVYHNQLGIAWAVDAGKDGERWVVHAESRYEAAVELMVQLGWDLEE